jgi:hypothetical protein
LGDLGINIGKIKTETAAIAFSKFDNSGLDLLRPIHKDPVESEHFYLKDFYGNMWEVNHQKQIFRKKEKSVSGGIYGAVIGVKNMEEAKEACILHIKLNHSSKNLSCECGKYFQYQCGFCRHSCPINNNKKRIVKSAFDEFNNKNDDTYDEAMEYIQKLKEIRYNRMLVDFMRDHGRF